MARRIFERLKTEHGFAGGYTVVKDYVRIVKGRSRETFVAHRFIESWVMKRLRDHIAE